MASNDVKFSGSVPASYDRYLVPMLFKPYADLVAARVAALAPKRILETATGTGVLTQALVKAVPDAEITATDLNQAMLDMAAERVGKARVTFRQCDALELPFEDKSFDLVVGNFGVMYYPDKVRGNSEARRVLRPGGHLVMAVWDRIELSPLSDLAHTTLEQHFPDNPPMFFKRGPHSYFEPEWIEGDLEKAGFSDIAIETIELQGHSPSADDAARGVCYGSPMRMELEEYGPQAFENVLADVTQAARMFEGPNGFDAPMSAHIVTATK